MLFVLFFPPNKGIYCGERPDKYQLKPAERQQGKVVLTVWRAGSELFFRQNFEFRQIILKLRLIISKSNRYGIFEGRGNKSGYFVLLFNEKVILTSWRTK
jgi:hypothetical protein